MKRPTGASISRAVGATGPSIDPRARASRIRAQRPAAVLLGAAGLLAVAGAILPWETVKSPTGIVDRSGLESQDAVLTIVLGLLIVLGGLVALRRPASGYWRFLLGLGSVVTVALALFDAGELQRTVTALNAQTKGVSTAGLGIGLYLVLLGGVLALVGTLRLSSRRRATGSPAAKTPGGKLKEH
jgi:hypothetical protein